MLINSEKTFNTLIAPIQEPLAKGLSCVQDFFLKKIVLPILDCISDLHTLILHSRWNWKHHKAQVHPEIISEVISTKKLFDLIVHPNSLLSYFTEPSNTDLHPSQPILSQYLTAVKANTFFHKIKFFNALFKGTCHGQALALAVEIATHPEKQFSEAIHTVTTNPNRVFRLQLASMMGCHYLDEEDNITEPVTDLIKSIVKEEFKEEPLDETISTFVQNQLQEGIIETSAVLEKGVKWKKGAWHLANITYNTISGQTTRCPVNYILNALGEHENALFLLYLNNPRQEAGHALLFSIKPGEYAFYDPLASGGYVFKTKKEFKAAFYNHCYHGTLNPYLNHYFDDSPTWSLSKPLLI